MDADLNHCGRKYCYVKIATKDVAIKQWWKTAERANDTKMGEDQNCATDVNKCKYNSTCILILWFLPQYENQKILKLRIETLYMVLVDDCFSEKLGYPLAK